MHPFFRPTLLLLLSLIPISSPSGLNIAAGLNITGLMYENSCKTFAGLLYFSANVADCFTSNLYTGITIFCPSDPVFDPFLPQFENLTDDGKISLLLYHAIPIYYSIPMMKSGNGVVNTLATDGIEKNYNFTIQNDGDVVTLRTEGRAARVTNTIFDADPVGLYSIDHVLMPEELFKKAEVAVDSPNGGGAKGNYGSPAAAAGPDGKAADQKAANDVGGAAAGAGKFVVSAVVAVFALAFV